MHKININLHNLKAASIFSMEICEIIRLDMVYVYIPNFIIFRRSAAEIPPPPPGCEMGSKDPAFLGLRMTRVVTK